MPDGDGDAACWLDQVCDECGAFVEDRRRHVCRVPATGQRSKFAGGDQAYLRDEQYADSSRLGARAALHLRYGTAAVPWFDWVATHVGLRAGDDVLEVGCGPGTLWAETSVPIPPGVSLTLVDLSQGMVAEATARAAAGGRLAGVDGRVADLQALPFGDDGYDRVLANHMLYHLPAPARGVAELARVVRADGVVVVATNGRHHLRELGEIRVEVFGGAPVDSTIDVFGAEVGFAVLRDHFDAVCWYQYHDELRCTDPADVLAYLRSHPPGEDADGDELVRLEAAVHRRFAAAGGVLTVSKDVGCFVCTGPR